MNPALKKIYVSLLIAALSLSAVISSAQTLPQAKVDLSIAGRGDDETLQPGYTVWRVAQGMADSLTIDGITYIFSAPTDASYVLRTGWNKNFVQNADYKAKDGRLTGDGLSLDPSTEVGIINLTIKGLPKGTHTLQTYHNRWENPETFNGWPISVTVNGQMVHSRVETTFWEAVSANASLLTTTLTVDEDGAPVSLSFYTAEDEAPVSATKSKDNKAPVINGFELNTVSVTAQAKDPTPSSGDMHVDCDAAHSCLLTWSPANSSVVSHLVYFSTDSTLVSEGDASALLSSQASADTACLVTDLTNLECYFWRVDEVDAQCGVTPGNVWSFRPRHLAFPGAEGYGRFAIGGRGGIVYHVTNLLDDCNPGSFRYGIECLTGPRTIVFDVAGVIVTQGVLSVSDRYVTIAGQTAPGKGICFHRSSDATSGAIGLGGKDLQMRFVRNRVGSGETTDGMGMRGADHSIIDHCTVSWSIDEGFSSRESYNITLQRTIISEALNVAGHDHYAESSAHGFAAVFGGDISSIHHNLLANNSGRNPRLDGGMEGDGTYKGRVDYFNNVVYNWNAHPSYGEAHQAQFYNNYYKIGPATTRQWILRADVNQRGSNKGTESYYFMGNVLAYQNGAIKYDGSRHGDGTDTNTDGGMWQLTNPMTVDWTVWVDQPWWDSHATVHDAQTAYRSVLSDVGCTLPVTDEHDARILDEVRLGTYTYTGSSSGLKGLIDTDEDCGGLESYPEEHRAADFDSDQDGLPDWWEELYGSNPYGPIGDYSDTNADADGDGYTALEHYLDYMATPHYAVESANGGSCAQIDLSELFAGFSSSSLYQLDAVPDGFSARLQGNLLTLVPVSGFSGIRYFTVSVADGSYADSRRVAVLYANGQASGIESLSSDPNVTPYKCYDLYGRALADPNGLCTSGHHVVLRH